MMYSDHFFSDPALFSGIADMVNYLVFQGRTIEAGPHHIFQFFVDINGMDQALFTKAFRQAKGSITGICANFKNSTGPAHFTQHAEQSALIVA